MYGKRVSPLGAVARGLIAGAIGSAAQSLFFKLTSKVAPSPPEGAFEPPEPAQRGETVTQTVARRFAEGMMARPLDEERKTLAGQLVHYGFGAAWGGLWGMVRESVPAMAKLPQRAAGTFGFSSLVWMIGDELMLPTFRLSAWPNRYPPAVHAFAYGAHVAYGLATCLAYEAMRPRSTALLASALSAMLLKRRLSQRLPAPARPTVGAAVDALSAVRRGEFLARSQAALQELRGI